jgi:pyrroloquinoline quinone biosynthesis protein A
MAAMQSSKGCSMQNPKQRRMNMWTKPEVTEMRFGFEVTMYVCNR